MVQDEEQTGASYPTRIIPGDPSATFTITPRIKALIIALPIVVVLLIGAIAFALIRSHGGGDRDDASSQPQATHGRFTLPATAGGLPRSSNPSLVAEARSTIGAVAVADASSVAGVYQSPTDPNDAFILIGLTTSVADPGTAVATVFTDLAASGDYAFYTKKSYDPGDRGGVMTCASAIENAVEVPWPSSVCVVGDSGGLIIALYVSHSGAANAAVTQAVRPTFEP